MAVIRAPEPVRRKISECLALMPADSKGTIDPGFAKDVEAAIEARKALEPARLGRMLDSTAAGDAERQGKTARRLLEAVVSIPGLKIVPL